MTETEAILARINALSAPLGRRRYKVAPMGLLDTQKPPKRSIARQQSFEMDRGCRGVACRGENLKLKAREPELRLRGQNE